MKYLSIYLIIIYFIYFLGCSSQKDTKSDVIKSAGNTSQTQTAREYSKDEFVLITEDTFEISTNYYYDEQQKDVVQPLVILIHQFNQNKNQWKKSNKADFIDSLINAGYKVLSYDIRGHGNSSKVKYDLSNILTDPNGAPNDIQAVFRWTRGQKGIDTTRIAVVGTSIGGSLAGYARYFLGAKTIVCISNGKDSYEKLSGFDPRMMGRVVKRITGVLFICGNRDDGVLADEKYLMEQYIYDPMELKVFDSDKHGKDLIKEHPEIYTLILDWLKKYL
jgi:dienelactone hydrolase